jgi:outer membrane receptor protein involved in Fe transport
MTILHRTPAQLLRRTALAGSMIVLLASTVAAQEQTAPASDTADIPDTIVVTGSRIARPEIEAPSPVTSLSAESLKASGQTSAGEIIQYIPALFSSVSSDLSATRGGILGGTSLNLRGLGATRTLVLVNGRRHVSSDTGTAIVDVDTIPNALIERVDVLTGGSSAVYGSDAVTGVVNYILKKNFTGIELDAQVGMSGKGDAEEFFAAGTFGKNFGGDKGNIVFGIQYTNQEPLAYGDRKFLRGNQRLDDDANPALRFQADDTLPAGRTAADTVGRTILRADGTPRYPNTPQALIDRARTAAPRAFLPGRTFSISSPFGIIGFDPDGSFLVDDLGTDFDNNGVNDCDQTYNFSGTGYGCYVVDPTTGRVRPFRDGLIAAFANGFGGDGIGVFLDSEQVVPEVRQINVNLNLNYEVNDAFKPFIEAKFVRTNASDVNNVNSFNDTIPIQLDNPFIPAELRTAINNYYGTDPQIGQLLISRDNTDFGTNKREIERDTYRIVGGFTGNFAENFGYEVSFNFGQTKVTDVNLSTRLEDRFYAAVDAVRAPNGQIVCRSSLNPNVIPGTSPFPGYDADPDGDGIFEPDTFRTNDGTCKPLNLFGLGAPSPEAIAFVNIPDVSSTTLRQYVATAVLNGDSSNLVELPGGPIRFATGGEYRRESSKFEVSDFQSRGLFFESGTQPEAGKYSVWEVFSELELPVLRDMPFAELLTFGGAARYSKYSKDVPQVGGIFTWSLNGVYAPVKDIRVRGGYNRAIRAPNVTNLFSPTTPATFRPIDPCDQANVNRGPNPATRLANCRADGIPAGFTDPLTARVTGSSGGNRNLQEERSDSWTIGAVFQPRFIERLSLTVDYWNYKIVDAIADVSGQDIVDGCYDSPDFPNAPFCSLFSRNRVPGTIAFLGFNNFTSGPVNFQRFKTSGIDAQVNYRLPLENAGFGNEGALTFRAAGTYLRSATFFLSATDPNSEDKAKGEAQRPEYAFNTGLGYEIGNFRIEWESFWQSKQYYQGVESEDPAQFAEPNRTGSFWSHDVSASWKVNDNLKVRAGINNLTNKKPFPAEAAYPVSPVGRSFFLGATAKF